MNAAALLALLVLSALGAMHGDWHGAPGQTTAPVAPAARPTLPTGPLPGLGLAAPPPDEYTVAPGHFLAPVATGLTFPTAVHITDDGRVYVAESGHSPGPALALPRILQIGPLGAKSVVALLPDAPITGLSEHGGLLYAIGGRGPASIWSVDPATGKVDTVLTGLPVWGHHYTSSITFDQQGRMYFAVGSPTNSGIVGLDDYHTEGYLSIFPEARDLPCQDLTLAGAAEDTANPFDPDPRARVVTGAYHRFGEPGTPGEALPSALDLAHGQFCTGALYRANADGSHLELLASGLRDVHAIVVRLTGEVLANDRGMAPSGSRPVKPACDAVWQVQPGAWYGFPDYTCGVAATDPSRWAPEHDPPTRVLAKDPVPPTTVPWHKLPPYENVAGMAEAKASTLAPPGTIVAALEGSFFQDPPVGHKIVAIEGSGERPLYVNLKPGPEGTAPERPVGLAFAPDGSLYFTDFGNLYTTTKSYHPSALTGGLWRISPLPTVDDIPGVPPT